MSKEKITEKIRKKYGEEAIMLFGEGATKPVEVISTGIPKLDTAIGIGGLPKGRIVELFGEEGVGKSTAALHAVVEAQKQGGLVGYIDLEHALDPAYATALGVDLENVLISQPSSGEEALDILEELVRSEEVAIVIFDSVAALAPKDEINGEPGDSLPGKVARLMGQALRKIVPPTAKNKCIVVFVNQLRSTIGGFGYGPQTTTTGGKALKYAASIRLEIKRIGSVKSGEKIIGNKTKIRVVKNKFSPPYEEAEVDLIFGEGFNKESDILDAALEKGVVTLQGTTFYFGDEKIGRGREKARVALKDIELQERIVEAMNKHE